MKHKISKNLLFSLILSLVIFCVLPIIINLIFLKASIPSAQDLNNPEWLDFWGSFLGGAIGGIITLLTVYFTMIFYEKQYETHLNELEEEKKRYITESDENKKQIQRKEYIEYMREIELIQEGEYLHLVNLGRIACYEITIDGIEQLRQVHSNETKRFKPNSIDLSSQTHEITLINAIGNKYKYKFDGKEMLQTEKKYFDVSIPQGAYFFTLSDYSYGINNMIKENENDN